MLPVEKLPMDLAGLSPEMREELEKRVCEFEEQHEAEASSGGAGYVDKIRKGDYAFAAIVNGIIVIYFIIAVLMM